MHKGIAVLGSTGSIGVSALDVIAHLPEGYRLVALSCRSNVSLAEEQIARFRPKEVAVLDPAAAAELRRRLPDGSTQVSVGLPAISEICRRDDVDLVVGGICGSDGLLSTLAALEAGKTLALASKEPIVMAGPHVMELARGGPGTLIPVDSEPNAIFQCLQGVQGSAVRRLLLTASGGPFFGRSDEELAAVTPAEALAHPVWRMGRRISVDSATLMNKGLEVIEAHHVFDVGYDDIDIVVHPGSVVHSMVELVDGTTLAALGAPDMRIPLQFAITYPRRLPTHVPPLDLSSRPPLEFDSYDLDAFPSVALAYRAGREGGTMPAVLSAADDFAVAAFIEGRIGFRDIPRVVETVMAAHEVVAQPSVEDVLAADEWAKRAASEVAAGGVPCRS